MTNPEVQMQREYYTRTAGAYENMHMQGDTEHDLACAILSSLAGYYQFSSILDIGSGTGRAVVKLNRALSAAKVVGIEPVEALRKIGYQHGIPEAQLIDGDATNLSFSDGQFDLVCELGVLHHIPKPREVVAEMLRVAKKAIFISDANRFGQGSLLGRYIKIWLWKLGLWPLVNWVKTKGRGYDYSEGDGVAYSYSVFDDYDFISQQCEHVMIFNLDGTGKNALTGAAHVALLAIKKS